MKIDIEKVKRRQPREERIPVSMKIPKSLSKFLREKEVSLTALFIEAGKSIGWTEEPKE